MGETFAGGLLSRGQFSLLLLDVPQFRVVDIIILALFLFNLSQICLQFGMSLLRQLGLKHQTPLSRLIEKVRTICKPIIAELLCDTLGVRTFGPLLNEIIQETKDLEVEALQAIILIIIQLLRNRVIIPL